MTRLRDFKRCRENMFFPAIVKAFMGPVKLNCSNKGVAYYDQTPNLFFLKGHKVNVISKLIERIEEYSQTTKKPCKLYKTEQSAEKAIQKIAELCKSHFETNETPRYVTFFVPSLGKWTSAIDQTEFHSRPDCKGGYLGIVANNGFFSY